MKKNVNVSEQYRNDNSVRQYNQSQTGLISVAYYNVHVVAFPRFGPLKRAKTRHFLAKCQFQAS
jgi:hypothetical protein